MIHVVYVDESHRDNVALFRVLQMLEDDSKFIDPGHCGDLEKKRAAARYIISHLMGATT